MHKTGNGVFFGGMKLARSCYRLVMKDQLNFLGSKADVGAMLVCAGIGFGLVQRADTECNCCCLISTETGIDL